MNCKGLGLLLLLALAGCDTSAPQCSPGICSGCCDSNGVCQAGQTGDACGAQGNACSLCLVVQVCQQGACVAPTPGGGAGGMSGGTGGGTAGGAGGGTAGGLAGGGATCTPETNAQLCQAHGATCGSYTAVDRCQVTRTFSCGTCPAHSTCGGGGTAGQCGCTPEPDATFCARNTHSCGPASGTDNCGVARTVTNCGTCVSPNTCNAGTCSCASETNAQFCARLGAACGTVTANDLCGQLRSANCGSCPSGRTCGGGGTASQCGCTPETDAAFCSRTGQNCGAAVGADNCGNARAVADCGTCTSPQTCGGASTPNVCGCTPESTASFLARLGKNCGTLTGLDNCGLTRTAYGPSCSGYDTCGGAGTPNVCGCTPQTDAELCMAVGNTCGALSTGDRCGKSRTVASCGACASGTRCTVGTYSRSSCQAFTCSSSQRACGAACATCPTVGVATTQCGANDTCVAATCATDYELVSGVCQPVMCPAGQRSCGGACRSCPSSNVATTSCSGPACIASTCLDGSGVSGGACVPMTCGAGQLFCSTACANCPTTGAATFGCNSAACVARSCAAGYALTNTLCVDSDWTVEVIDSSADYFSSSQPRGAAIALSPSGVVYAAYTDPPNVVVAHRTASGWAKTPVVLGYSGLTAVTNLAVDAAGNAHVIYYTYTPVSYDSTYAYWYVKISPTGATSLASNLGLATYYSGGTLSAAEGIALALDSAGDAHVAFNRYVYPNNRLVYARTFQGAWLAPLEVATVPLPYPAIAVDAAGAVHIAGASGGQLLYTKGVNSIFPAPSSSASASVAFTELQLLLTAGGPQIWARAGRNVYQSTVTGTVLSTPTGWGALTGTPSYVTGAADSNGLTMLEEQSSNGAVTARRGPVAGPTLIEVTNLPLGFLEHASVVDANGTFHALAWKTASGADELSYVRGH